MKLSKSENAQENYLATVVECPKLEDHPNADRLSIAPIFGGNVIVGKDSYKEKEILVYFPIESSIDSTFLSWANLYDDPNLNADGVTKSFFQAKGRRVKPLKLRGIASEGFLYPVSKLAEFYKVNPFIFKVGESFDQVGDKILLEKWVSGAKSSAPVKKKAKIPFWVQKLPRPLRKFIGNRFYSKKDEGIKSSIMAGQFQFHYSTPQFAKSFFALKPEDEITISEKIHGASSIFANILCYKQKNKWQKLFGIQQNKLEKEYKLIVSSRSVIKNLRAGGYSNDIWGQWAKKIESKNIPDGVTIFSEIAGYINSGKMVQKGYDYSHLPGESGLYVYRVTKTSKTGEVYEYTFKEIVEFCKQYDLKTVPIHYQGSAKDLFPEIEIDENWNKSFCRCLSEKYLEKNCATCKNKVPNEGVVLRIESKDGRPAFKHKSFAFKLRESGDRDKGETNIEDES